MNLPAHELNQTWKKFETHVSFKQLVKITKVLRNDDYRLTNHTILLQAT